MNENGTQLLATKKLTDLQDSAGNYPHLKRTMTSTQAVFALLAIPLMVMRGVGLIILVLDLGWFLFSKTYRIHNQTDDTIFAMTKGDYQTYKRWTKQQRNN
ncbi:hypothetical protein [Lapidilactobacillus bayanensis]|uniref:hypothetical protein n=1 Tax=Lapidilactobacillus bayanensis TaxID=2485998 RepID=UPI000F7A9A28|nr:hypothetical protein [Lapidilactobacillus bayanensis]